MFGRLGFRMVFQLWYSFLGLRGQSEEKELQQQKVLDHNCCKHTGFLVNYAFKPRLPTTERVENTENKPDQCSRPGLFTKHILEVMNDLPWHSLL